MLKNGYRYFKTTLHFFMLTSNKTGLIVILLSTYNVALCSNNIIYKYNERIDFKQFLHNELHRAKVEITKSFLGSSHLHNKFKRDSFLPLNVSWNRILVNNKTVSTQKQYAFNEIFLNEGILYIVNASEQSTGKVDKNTELVSRGSFTFLKRFDWNNLQLFLLGSKTGECFLYTLSSDSGDKYIQLPALHHPNSKGSYAVDGEFFLHNNNLYLFLIYDTSTHESVTSVLYKWQNMYFDTEIEDVSTKGAVGVTSLIYGSSIIIVVIQSGNDESNQTGSLVLKFSRKDQQKIKLERIQFLPTKKPYGVINFRLFNNKYILVNEKESPSKIYWWEGGEFTEWLEVPHILMNKSVISGYIHGYTLLLIYENTQITLYVMTWKDLKEVGSISFDDEIIHLSIDSTILKVVLKKEKKLTFKVIEISVEASEGVFITNGFTTTYDRLSDCMNNVESEMSTTTNKLHYIHRNFTNMLFTDSEIIIDGKIKVIGTNSSVNVTTGSVKCMKTELQSRLLNNSIHNYLNDLADRYDKFLQVIKQTNERNFKNNFDVIFQKNLFLNYLKINLIKAFSINGYHIDDNKFLRLNRSQNLNYIKTKFVNIDWLTTNTLATKFINDLILNNLDDKEWSHHVSVNNLTCYYLVFSKKPLINNIDLNDVVLISNITNIAGLKKNTCVEAPRISLNNINEITFMKWFDELTSNHLNTSWFHLDGDTEIHHLNANYIDNIEINTILQNIFVPDASNNIIDVMTTQSIVKENVLNLELMTHLTTLEVLVVDDVIPFTSTYTFVNGDLYFEKGFQAKKLKIQTVNSTYQNQVFNPSFNAKQSSPGNENLEVKYKIGERGESNPDDIYLDKFQTEGCVQAYEVIFDNGSLFTGNEIVPITSLEKLYWISSKNQIIRNAVKSYNKLYVDGNMKDLKTINGINIDDLLDADDVRKINRSLSFKNVTIVGNVESKNSDGNPKCFDITKLNRSATALSSIDFEQDHQGKGLQEKNTDKLEVRRGDIYDLSHKLDDLAKTLEKHFVTERKHTFYGNVKVQGNIKMDYINDVVVSNFSNKNLYYQKNSKLPDILAKNINVTELNGVPFTKITRSGTYVNDRKIIKKLKIINDINLKEITAEKINDMNLNSILTKVVNGSKSNTVKGKKVFQSTLIIENNLKTESVNFVPIQDMFTNCFSKRESQVIMAKYNLTNVSIDSLEINNLNAIDMLSLIDTSSEDIFINSSEMHFEKLFISGNITAQTVHHGCHLPKQIYPIFFDKSNKWQSIDATENVHWNNKNEKSKGAIQTLFDDAVVKNRIQRISGAVTFSQDLIASNVYTEYNINFTNVSHIISDAVLTSKKKQVITGEKIFLAYIYCDYITVLEDAFIDAIDGINILKLNGTVIKRNTNQVIAGKKYFDKGFNAFIFNTGGSVNGILTKQIVITSETKFLPYVTFKNLEITHDFNFRMIDSHNLKNILSERVLIRNMKTNEKHIINSELTFKNVIINGKSIFGSLNNIQINDVIVKSNTFSLNKRMLHNYKIFINPLQFQGKLDVKCLNEEDFLSSYDLSIFSDKDLTITGNVKFNGNITMKSTIYSTSTKNKSTVSFLNSRKSDLMNFINYLLKRKYYQNFNYT
ncbi:uncharacterized protein LOC142322572 [Lycorma delicatula]|uniref:uncharacterized protein LOC142322572 n=1 Tax=Lycorma delicatula TaxID=130591 RepID=UPI003F513AAD